MSVTQPLGFRAAGLAAGIKPSGKPDLCLIARDQPAPGSATPHTAGSAMSFTTNAVVGAPIIIGQRTRAEVLSARQKPVAAIFINAGNSNAATGQQGVLDALACCQALAPLLGITPEEVLPSSTGVIGRPLPVAKMLSAIPTLARQLARGSAADAAAAGAIMTTDLAPKSALARVHINGREITIGAIAKGSGMIAPRLDTSADRPPVPSATMLAFITTDAPIDSTNLQAALDACCQDSFNRISVDNHPSCSDTVAVLSSGQAGGEPIVAGTPAFTQFTAALATLCRDLAEQIVVDGEGATRIFQATVRGAATDDAATRIAREIINSPLVKCAIHGQDPNWGRIVTAGGNAGVRFDPAHASLSIGPVEVYRAGVPVVAALTDPRLKHAMAGKRVEVVMTVGTGPGQAWMLGCDLSKQYVSINAEYTT